MGFHTRGRLRRAGSRDDPVFADADSHRKVIGAEIDAIAFPGRG